MAPPLQAVSTFRNVTMDACIYPGVEHPTIHIAARWTGQSFIFTTENSYDVQYRRQGGRFLSRKRDGFGLGLESVRETVTQYGGSLDVYPLEKLFRVGIILPSGGRHVG